MMSKRHGGRLLHVHITVRKGHTATIRYTYINAVLSEVLNLYALEGRTKQIAGANLMTGLNANPEPHLNEPWPCS